MRIVITGAAGKIATQAIEELHAFHDLCLTDIRSLNSRSSVVADLAKPANEHSLDSVFADADAVLHLAANADQHASWREVSGANVEATRNVLEAAAKHRVPRFVFASSNWAVKALENELAPRCYLPTGPKIGSHAPPCPVNAYGLSKALGEAAGRMFVDQDRLESVVAVRIGAYRTTPTEQEEVQRLWIGINDMRSLLRRCLEAEFAGFHVVYGVSAQSSAPYDLTHTQTLLSWRPSQIASSK